ncbi:MAG TPA: alpha/beta hydrolase [Firmicutes bacterium]|nr:alpha/beta hydrolase [Bacillota bacterium]
MRKRSTASIIVVLVMLLFSLTSHVQAALPPPEHTAVENNVEFQNQGQTIRGTLTKPDAEGPFPVVIIFHGFSGQRHEMPVVGTEEALFQRTARVLAEQGYASLRIDFRGSGESDGQWADTTFSGQISDALAAVDYVCGLDAFDPNRVAVLGLSQGGLVAASAAGRDPRIASAVLWSAVANPPATYSDLLGADAVTAGLTGGVDDLVTASLPWGATTTLKGSFFRELYMVDPVAEIAAFKSPLLVIVGLTDIIVSPQPQSGEIYLAYHPGDEALVQLDADHMFDCLARPEKVDEAICATVDWLGKTL